MSAIVHGHSGFVEKSNDVVSQQMVLNKLWIPDVLIDIIKDFLYVSAAEVLRKFYRAHLNRSITSMYVNYTPKTDIYGRDRQIVYAIGHVYGTENVQLQGTICVTCGDFDHFHNNMNGCCPQQFDLEDEPIYLVDNGWEEHNQTPYVETETIPEVIWDIDIPVANQPADALRNLDLSTAINTEEVIRQQAENALWGRQPEHYDYDEDVEPNMDEADYAEYMREIEMEAYSNGRR
jgi:hypothetical protein